MKKILSSFIMIHALLLSSNSLFSEEGGELPPRNGGMWQTLIMIGIALAFFYLILWRPEQKRRKALDEQRNAMKKGDRVSAMGIIGTVHSIKENTVILNMVDSSKIEVLKGAVTEVLPSNNSNENDIKK